MKQVNIKSERVAELLEQVIARTSESEANAVANAFERRSLNMDAAAKIEDTLIWLKAKVWSKLDEVGAPSKAEQEELLGF